MNQETAVELNAEQQLIDIKNNLATVKQRIADACKKAGRDPASVRLLPVTKTVSAERLRIAYAAGVHEMGENKIQEAREKSEVLADLGIKWSIIGHLQTNKAKYLARFANEFQALDSLKVAEELDKRLQNEGRAIDVYVQVNSSAINGISSTDRIVTILTWWQKLLITLDIVFAGLAAGSIAMLILSIRKKKKIAK